MSHSNATQFMSHKVETICRQLGINLSEAILARTTRSAFARQLNISRDTLRKAMNGDPNVGLGVYVAAFDALNLSEAIASIGAAEHDSVGQAKRMRRGALQAPGPLDNDF